MNNINICSICREPILPGEDTDTFQHRDSFHEFPTVCVARVAERAIEIAAIYSDAAAQALTREFHILLINRNAQ